MPYTLGSAILLNYVLDFDANIEEYYILYDIYINKKYTY
jgi:hypothetical protein